MPSHNSTLPGASRRLGGRFVVILNSRHARQHIEHDSKIQFLPAHAARGGQEFVAYRGGGQRAHSACGPAPWPAACLSASCSRRTTLLPAAEAQKDRDIESLAKPPRCAPARPPQLRAGCRSSPASSTPSEKASICTARLRLTAIFMERATPLSPTYVTFGPISKQQRLQPFEGFFAPADHHRELALLQCDDAARNRRIHHVRALFANFGGKRAACLRAHRAHVDVIFTRSDAGEQSFQTVRHSVERGRIRDHGEGHIAGQSNRLWRIGEVHAA